ncbi:MAG: hypothetical protein P0120_14925 [Nitrospira sp.]|nr:hypothetical protein [Nitrospira sp.]
MQQFVLCDCDFAALLTIAMTLHDLSVIRSIIEAATGQVIWSVRDGGERMGRNSSRSRWRISSRFLALLAIQKGTQILIPSVGGEHPRAIREWGLVPDVLSMTTGQIRHPISVLILMIPDDRLLHTVNIPQHK